MHPEVRADRPGSCPKCGMAFEQKAGYASPEAESHERRDLKRGLLFAAVVTPRCRASTLCFPGLVPRRGRQVALYFEACCVIVTLILLGQILELRARHATGTAIKKLLGLARKTARQLKDDGSEEDVPLDAVCTGCRRC